MMAGNVETTIRTGSTFDPPAAVGWVLMLSMAGIVVVSLLYVASPPALVAPLVPLDVDAARAGALAAGRATDWIAPLGMVADPIAAAALMAIGWLALREDRGSEAIGWLMLGLSSLLFVIIDGTAGAVLPVLGRSAPSDGFTGIKRLSDAMFVAGTLCLSIGALFVAGPSIVSRVGRRDWLLWMLGINGLFGLCSGLAVLIGYNFALLVGTSVGIAAALLAAFGFRMLMSSR